MKLLGASVGTVTVAVLEKRSPERTLASLITDMLVINRRSPLVDGTRISTVRSRTYVEAFEVAETETVAVSPGLTLAGYVTSMSKCERENLRVSGVALTAFVSVAIERISITTATQRHVFLIGLSS